MRFRLFVWFLLLWPAALLATNETPLSSQITEVSVYRQRAQVVRSARSAVRQGDNLLVFTGLSRFIIPNSITVSGQGGGIIQSVSHRVSYLNKTPKTARMQTLEDSVAWLEAELEVLADEQFVRKSEENLLLENDKLAGDDTGLQPETLKQVAALYRERLSALRREQRDLSRQSKVYQKRIQAYQQELGQIRTQRNQPTQEVVVTFRAEKAGEVTLELRYLVNQAGWTPFYDIRVTGTDQPLQFFLKADVVNNTGIDWQGVKLMLSTTNNNVDNTQPSLSPWYVDISYPRQEIYPSAAPKRTQRDATANTLAGMVMESEAALADDASYAYDFTTTTEGELGLEFSISLPYDIPADNKPHQVDIQVQAVPGTFMHYAVPKLDRDAFLVAQINRDLLRGKANVYFEGTFVGETYVNTDNPRDSMRISLGRDPKVQVQRERIQDFTSRKVIGGNERMTYGFAISLRNNKSTPVRLTLEDQIPVSQNKDISVTLLDASGGQHDAVSGRISWDLTLAPGETRELQLQFEVKYPKDQPISGL